MDPFQRTHSASRYQGVVVVLLLLLGGITGPLSGTPAESEPLPVHFLGDPYAAWDGDLTPLPAKPFPPIAPFRAEYRFGWEGVPAGGARVTVTEPSPGRRALRAEGGPSGWVRSLWNYHARYFGEAGENGATPSWFHMDEEVAKGQILSDGWFPGQAVLARHHFTREFRPWWFTPLPGVRDLFAAMLLVRSLPLADGDVIRLTTFPDRNPYLVELRVTGRETIRIAGQPVKAARFTIRIWSIETQGPGIGTITPHRKFRSGRIWMSDDDRRLPLKAEVDVFIGAVFAELARILPPS